MKFGDDTMLEGALNVLKELPSRGISAGWRKESRGTFNIQQETSPAQEKSTGAQVRGGRGLLWGVRGGRAHPVGPQAARCLEGTTATSPPGILSSFRSRKPVFPPPRAAAIGNCSGYLAVKPGLTAEWRHENKQMHPKQHPTPTNHLGWKWLLPAEGWQEGGSSQAPRATFWVGVPATSAEGEIETQEEPNLPTPLISVPASAEHDCGSKLAVILPSLKTSATTKSWARSLRTQS